MRRGSYVSIWLGALRLDSFFYGSCYEIECDRIGLDEVSSDLAGMT